MAVPPPGVRSSSSKTSPTLNRPVTHASKAFVQALLDESVSPPRRRQLMMEAPQLPVNGGAAARGEIEFLQNLSHPVGQVYLNAPVAPVLQRLYCACFDPLWFNRFHGKGTQFNIAANGKMSMIIDHTFCDGGIEI